MTSAYFDRPWFLAPPDARFSFRSLVHVIQGWRYCAQTLVHSGSETTHLQVWPKSRLGCLQVTVWCGALTV